MKTNKEIQPSFRIENIFNQNNYLFYMKDYFSAATAVIHAESSVFVKPGSTISLTCSIKLFSSPPTNIQWYKDARALNLDSARGGVSLENEKTPIGTKSTLIVTKVINCITFLEKSHFYFIGWRG